jgi:hypothetical protein
MTKADILQLWKSGVQLSRAWQEFAPARKQRPPKFTQLKIPSRHEPNTGLGMLVETNKEHGQAIADLFAMGQSWVEQNGRKIEWREQLRTNLVKNLEQGLFVALGFSVNAQVDAGPTIVPIRLIDSQFFQWSRNEISDPPHGFIRVRVNYLNQNTSFGESVRPLRGRPTYKPEMMKAVKIAMSKNKAFLSIGRKAQSKEIQNLLRTIYPDQFALKPPSHRTIESFLPTAIKRSKVTQTS